jgi:hypothetical protein
MKKIIFILLILLVFVNTGVCAENFTTNIITEISPNIVGGDNLVMPHFHYYDSWFSVENAGYISYHIYQYNYTGSHKNYTDSFIAVLNPNQIVMLNNNASYKFYASYDEIQDYTDVEKVKSTFNRWWIYIFIGVILFSVIILGIKKVIKI